MFVVRLHRICRKTGNERPWGEAGFHWRPANFETRSGLIRGVLSVDGKEFRIVDVKPTELLVERMREEADET